jgi:uncharacterized protein YjgD (DUF1641 family)
MDQTPLKTEPNDICIVLRPTNYSDNWDGEFEVIIGTVENQMSKEDADSLLNTAMLMASVIPLMDQDERAAKIIERFFNKFYSESESVEFKDDDKNTLTARTKTVGSKH